MIERALGAAGLVLLIVSVVALMVRPRRSRRLADIGLAIGAGLLGIAVGLVVAYRPQPLSTGAAAPAVAPQAAEPAPVGYVESRLALQFPIDDEYPTSSGATNFFDWYASRNWI